MVSKKLWHVAAKANRPATSRDEQIWSHSSQGSFKLLASALCLTERVFFYLFTSALFEHNSSKKLPIFGNLLCPCLRLVSGTWYLIQPVVSILLFQTQKILSQNSIAELEFFPPPAGQKNLRWKTLFEVLIATRPLSIKIASGREVRIFSLAANPNGGQQQTAAGRKNWRSFRTAVACSGTI